MSLSGQTLQTWASQCETITCPSRQSFQTGLSSKTKVYDRRVFHQYYVELCERRSLLPLSCTKVQSKQGILDFNVDHIKLNHWGPLLTALCADRSLHHIAIHSKHIRKKVVESADSKLKAQAVTRHPVLYTHYVLSLLMDALAGCVRRSRVLLSLELDSLPLDKEYLSPLVEATKQCPSLQNLSLQGCSLGDAGCEVVCASVRNMPSILTLNLSHCGISSSGAVHVASMLEYQKIQRMSECWKHTLRYREANLDAIQGIRRVSLNNNPLEDQGVSCILDTVADDLWLKALDLQGCGLTDASAGRVLEMLEHNSSLAIVDLRLNPGVSPDTLARVMKRLHDNNAHRNPQYGWFPVKERLSKKSLTQTIASRFQLQLSRKTTLANLDVPRRSCEQRRPPVPRARLKQRVNSCGKTPPPSVFTASHDNYKCLEEERDAAVRERDAALVRLRGLQAELEHVRKERDEAVQTVDQLLGDQARGAEGFTLVRQDVFAAMEAIVKLLHTNGFDSPLGEFQMEEVW